MKARDLIEAETPKSVLKQVGASTHGGFTPRRLTPREIQRLSDVAAMGPLTKKPIDDRFLEWGYLVWYDNDERNAVEAAPGFVAALYNDPEIRGAVGKEWQDAPYQRRGRVRTWEGENPKLALRQAGIIHPRRTALVQSSGGSFTIDAETGQVLSGSIEQDYDGYNRIDKFDLGEWRRHWNWEHELPSGYDVLDLGFWMKDGSYEAADDEFRRNIREALIGRVAKPEQQTARIQNA